MVKWAVTHADLLAIKETEAKYRHELRDSVQKVYIDNDDIKIDIATLSQSAKSMNKDITEIKDTQNKIFDKISSLKDQMLASTNEQRKESELKFVSKTEYSSSSNRLDKIESVLQKVNWIVISWVLGAILTLIIKVWAI